MNIQIPHSGRQRALILVDIQPKTFAPGVLELIPLMTSFLKQTCYDHYVEATWSAPKESTFFLQSETLLPREEAGPTSSDLLEALTDKSAPVYRLHKTTRSAFKADGAQPLHVVLADNGIEEIHLIGVDINDCVLATAYDGADLGFFTCVIEELSHHSQGIEEMREAAIAVLRRQNMTNNSLLPTTQITSVTI